MSWYFKVLRQYAVFAGRAQRSEYWYFTLFNSLAFIVLGFTDALFGTFSAEAGVGIIGGLYWLAVFLPTLGVGVRRLHDTGRSGWWLVIVLIPIIGAIVLLFFLVKDSDPEANKYGDNPKLSGETEPAVET